MEIFLIRTPVRKVAELAYGGPLRICADGRSAYAAFASRSLAETVCHHWGITTEHFIEPWSEAVRHEVPGVEVRRAVLFCDDRVSSRRLSERQALAAFSQPRNR